MESLGSRSIRGRDREREREREYTETTLFKNMLNLYTCVCSMNTFYTSPFRTDRSTDSTSMLIKELLQKLSNIFLTEYLSNGLPVYAPVRPFLRTGLRTGFRTRPNRSVPTDPVLGFFSRCGRC